MWISERKGLLSILFTLLALHSYEFSKHRKFWNLLYVVFFALSLLSKSTAILLPILIIIQEIFLFHEKLIPTLKKQSAALTISFLWAIIRVQAYGKDVQNFSQATFSIDHFIQLPGPMLTAFGFYLSKFFLPVPAIILRKLSNQGAG